VMRPLIGRQHQPASRQARSWRWWRIGPVDGRLTPQDCARCPLWRPLDRLGACAGAGAPGAGVSSACSRWRTGPPPSRSGPPRSQHSGSRRTPGHHPGRRRTPSSSSRRRSGQGSWPPRSQGIWVTADRGAAAPGPGRDAQAAALRGCWCSGRRGDARRLQPRAQSRSHAGRGRPPGPTCAEVVEGQAQGSLADHRCRLGVSRVAPGDLGHH